jgi:hypothetical protein
VQPDRLVPRRVIDFVGTHELGEASRVALVEAYDSGGERNTEIAAAVFKGDVDPDRRTITDVRFGAAIILRRTGHLEGLTDRNSASCQQRQLFCLFVENRRRMRERVEVVFEIVLLQHIGVGRERAQSCAARS